MPHDENTPKHDYLTWSSNRWHCQGEPIHAGTAMEIRNPTDPEHPDAQWVACTIEGQDAGRRLIAWRKTEGIRWRADVKPWHQLRWPPSRDLRRLLDMHLRDEGPDLAKTRRLLYEIWERIDPGGVVPELGRARGVEKKREPENDS